MTGRIEGPLAWLTIPGGVLACRELWPVGSWWPASSATRRVWRGELPCQPRWPLHHRDSGVKPRDESRDAYRDVTIESDETGGHGGGEG